MTIAFESREPCARGCIADLAFVTGSLLYHEHQSKLSGKSLDQAYFSRQAPQIGRVPV
jgi:hypothetical protein